MLTIRTELERIQAEVSWCHFEARFQEKDAALMPVVSIKTSGYLLPVHFLVFSL